MVHFGKLTPTQRLLEIRSIIEAVDNRCAAADGPVTPTRHEITDKELRRIYQLSKFKQITNLPDACLISAAPEMLALAKNVAAYSYHDLCEDPTIWKELLEEARALLARIEVARTYTPAPCVEGTEVSQPITRDERDRVICFLFEHGWSVKQIAFIVKLAPRTVHRIIRDSK